MKRDLCNPDDLTIQEIASRYGAKSASETTECWNVMRDSRMDEKGGDTNICWPHESAINMSPPQLIEKYGVDQMQETSNCIVAILRYRPEPSPPMVDPNVMEIGANILAVIVLVAVVVLVWRSKVVRLIRRGIMNRLEKWGQQ